MSTTSSAPHAGAVSAHPPSTSVAVAHRTRAGLVALVGGAVLLAVARLFTTAGGSPADRLHQMSGSDVRVTASALLAIAGFAALVPGFLTVVAAVRGRGAVLATVGGALVVLGGIGFAVPSSIALRHLAATHVADPDPMRAYLHQLDVSPGVLALTPFAAIGYLIGPFLVTLAARRGGLVPRWLPWTVLAPLLLQLLGDLALLPFGDPVGAPGLPRQVAQQRKPGCCEPEHPR